MIAIGGASAMLAAAATNATQQGGAVYTEFTIRDGRKSLRMKRWDPKSAIQFEWDRMLEPADLPFPEDAYEPILTKWQKAFWGVIGLLLVVVAVYVFAVMMIQASNMTDGIPRH